MRRIIAREAVVLPSARVHFQVSIALELADLDQRLTWAGGQALLRAAVAACAPSRLNDVRQLLAWDAAPQPRAQIGAVAGVQTEIPEPVGGEPASIARATKGTRRGGDDP